MVPEIADAIGSPYTQTDTAITAAQMIPVENTALALLTILQQDFLDWKRGLQSDEVWESRKPLIAGVMVPDILRTWWNTTGNSYVVPEFREIVEQIMATDSRQGEYWKAFQDASEGTP